MAMKTCMLWQLTCWPTRCLIRNCWPTIRASEEQRVRLLLHLLNEAECGKYCLSLASRVNLWLGIGGWTEVKVKHDMVSGNTAVPKLTHCDKIYIFKSLRPWITITNVTLKCESQQDIKVMSDCICNDKLLQMHMLHCNVLDFRRIVLNFFIIIRSTVVPSNPYNLFLPSSYHSRYTQAGLSSA